MRLLLDSHTIIWAADNSSLVPSQVRDLILEPTNTIYVSAASIWEIAIKVGKGRLSLSLPYREWMERAIQELGLKILPLFVTHADRQTKLPHHHLDPFDRLLIAQSLEESLPIASTDQIFDSYGVVRIWD